jgi:YD repeat-containing protein
MANLTRETIEKDGRRWPETLYEYELTFNKLTRKRERRAAGDAVHDRPEDGDLLATLDPVGNLTEYHYDADGRLEWTKDPRKLTTRFRVFNDFGSPGEIENPLGQVTYRTYDSRNRLVEELEEPYHRVTRAVYDGFDRPVERVSARRADDGRRGL